MAERPTIEEFERELENFADYEQGVALSSDRFDANWNERHSNDSKNKLLAMFRAALEPK